MGYYVAQALGYYNEENLRVSFIPGGPGIDPGAAIQSGRADAVVEWMPTVLASRERGIPLVNVAQIFQHSGLLLICQREHEILSRNDLHDITISVWLDGNEVPLLEWLNKPLETADKRRPNVDFIEQTSVTVNWHQGEVDCVSAMSYNEYWTLLEQGVPLSTTTIFRLQELGFDLLEDGIYVDARRLEDPVFDDRLRRFLSASIRGWNYAIEHPVEAVEFLLQIHPELDKAHQLRMAEEVVRLVDQENFPLGLLQIAAYDNTLERLDDTGDSDNTGYAPWSHDYWYDIDPSTDSLFSIEVRYRLQQVLSEHAFYILDLIGTLAFGIAGFIRAQQQRYDIWGALVATSLPAVGGGTIRDVLVYGGTQTPFIFANPVYMYIIVGIVAVGSLTNLLLPNPRTFAERFPGLHLYIDTIGLAAFTIIGAKVAILAQLNWFWIPCLAALTCAGGGVLLDIFTGQKPRTFRGVIYEEIAIAGGLFLAAMLYIANYVSNVHDFIVVTIIATFVLVFCARVIIVKRGWMAPRLRASQSAA